MKAISLYYEELDGFILKITAEIRNVDHVPENVILIERLKSFHDQLQDQIEQVNLHDD